MCGCVHLRMWFPTRDRFCQGKTGYIQLAPAICRWLFSEEIEAKSSPTSTVHCHTGTTEEGALCVLCVCVCACIRMAPLLAFCQSTYLTLIQSTTCYTYTHTQYTLSGVPFTLMRRPPLGRSHTLPLLDRGHQEHFHFQSSSWSSTQ